MPAELPEISKKRCIICGYRKTEIEERALPPLPLCLRCGSEMFRSTLATFLEQVDSEIDSSKMIRCEDTPLLSFPADIGMLGCQNHFIASLRSVLSTITRQVTTEGVASIEDICRLSNPYHTLPFLDLLGDLRMVQIDDNKNMLAASSEIFEKAAISTEIDPHLNRASTFILGYVTLGSIALTLEITKTIGTLYVGQGITKMYPGTYKGKPRILTSYTAPISFILDSFSKKLDEFDDAHTLKPFLLQRGIGTRKANRIINWFTGSRPGSLVALYDFKMRRDRYGTIVYDFKLNPDYAATRDRVLELMRERQRTRGD